MCYLLFGYLAPPKIPFFLMITKYFTIPLDGKPEGWWKSYNERGILISEGNRKNFQLDSLWIFYNDDSSFKMKVHYSEGKKNGEQIVYNENEYTVTQWNQDTIIASVNTYKKDGTLLKTIPYENGLPNGLSKEFNDTGLVVAVTRYYRGVRSRRETINKTDKFGLKQGGWKYFWDNGNLKIEAQYLNNKKHGFFKYYNENGDLLYVEKFEHDYFLILISVFCSLILAKRAKSSGRILTV